MASFSRTRSSSPLPGAPSSAPDADTQHQPPLRGDKCHATNFYANKLLGAWDENDEYAAVGEPDCPLRETANPPRAIELRDLNEVKNGEELLSCLISTYDYPLGCSDRRFAKDDEFCEFRSLGVHDGTRFLVPTTLLTKCDTSADDREQRDNLLRWMQAEDIEQYFQHHVPCFGRAGFSLQDHERSGSHVKLYAFVYGSTEGGTPATRLRIAIGSANFFWRSWEMQNELLWMRDFSFGETVSASQAFGTAFGRNFLKLAAILLKQDTGFCSPCCVPEGRTSAEARGESAGDSWPGESPREWAASGVAGLVDQDEPDLSCRGWQEREPELPAELPSSDPPRSKRRMSVSAPSRSTLPVSRTVPLKYVRCATKQCPKTWFDLFLSVDWASGVHPWESCVVSFAGSYPRQRLLRDSENDVALVQAAIEEERLRFFGKKPVSPSEESSSQTFGGEVRGDPHKRWVKDAGGVENPAYKERSSEADAYFDLLEAAEAGEKSSSATAVTETSASVLLCRYLFPRDLWTALLDSSGRAASKTSSEDLVAQSSSEQGLGGAGDLPKRFKQTDMLASAVSACLPEIVLTVDHARPLVGRPNWWKCPVRRCYSVEFVEVFAVTDFATSSRQTVRQEKAGKSSTNRLVPPQETGFSWRDEAVRFLAEHLFVPNGMEGLGAASASLPYAVTK